ncbi:phage minor head protein [Planomicrobium sp. CPCC 101079]|uniref:phage minor head protein n=1 Tax=Planomicrobium sp. CPCC 101079 TaxID=2599618 RepID=UPI00210588FB|nr:phage minor head protein [Planomicrobium sp. CPCC 101079]
MDWFKPKRERKLRQQVRAAAAGAKRTKQTEFKWEQQWGLYEKVLSRKSYSSKEVIDSLRVIRDLNPDASMAIWNLQRLVNSGFEVEAQRPDGTVDDAMTEQLEALAKRVGLLYGGGMDQLVGVWTMAGYTSGGFAAEVELTENLDDVVDIHVVEATTIDFLRNKENKIEMVQKQSDGSLKVLNPETVFYYPLDPDVGDPYGRSPLLPILQIVFFQVQVLKDLQRVIHHQGYERFDISIVEEAIMNALPDEIKHDGEEVQKFVQQFVGSVEKQFSELEPDADFIHTDSVKVTTAGGAGSKSMDATRVIEVINQQIVSALKMLPILLGRNEGTTETHGTVQWQIFVAGVKSIQRTIKRLMERSFNVYLQIQGFQGRAKVTFNDIPVRNAMLEAQAEQLRTSTIITQVQQGWIDNNEAANEIVGHDAVGTPTNPVLNQFRPPTSATRMMGKNRADDEVEEGAEAFIGETEEPWAEQVAEITDQAEDAFGRFLEYQRKEYIARMKAAGTPLSSDEEAIEVFRDWVESNILYDSSEQLALWNELGQDWMTLAAVTAGEVSALTFDADVVFNSQDEVLLRALSDRSRRSAEFIQDATDERVIMSLWDVVAEGKYSIDKAAKALQEDEGFSKARARVIARTEMLGAARTGQNDSDRQSGLVIGKIWRSAKQDRTRPGHQKANDQVVAFDEPFRVENGKGQVEELMFPGDSSMGASASNVIQCRCWYKRILQGEEHLLRGGE